MGLFNLDTTKGVNTKDKITEKPTPPANTTASGGQKVPSLIRRQLPWPVGVN